MGGKPRPFNQPFLVDAKKADNRPPQTGMEAKWEVWIRDVTNFLNGNNIPVYDTYLDGGKGKAMDISARLKVLGQYLGELRVQRGRAERALRETKEVLGQRTTDFQHAADVIEQAYRGLELGEDDRKMAEALDAIETWLTKFRPYVVKEKADDSEGSP